MASPSPQGYSPAVFWAFLRRTNLGTGLSALIVGRGSARGIFLAHRGPSQSPAPPPKAIAHTFFGHFCGGRTWGRGLRALIFGRGSARGLVLAHGVPLESLAPFRVRRTNLASPSPQGYHPPVFWAFLRRTNLGMGPSGSYFWVRQCPRHIFGTRRPLVKSGPIPSPADELGQPLPPRL